ncbi:MFS transporter [Nodosilinea sp. LEGE 07298]|uniref:MFS transporter n=1 Tax=Nodosilinea sp. LEGE 07298 TaxID=2777970 RepID=UPI001881E03D|nr:MFS transporter [Nodosilinea sp. LEGE 07298]MBE9110210.1 MFS transporter [Nodosilinea sp. LEGE 07298]
MTFSTVLQLSNRQVSIQAIGRLLIQVSYGLINFYIPILFVNQMGFSATAVGFALSLCAVSEVGGHFIGGTLADSPRFGRKAVLSLAAILGVVVSGVLLIAHSLWLLVVASFVLGISLGFYWTASGAAVMDVTEPEDRSRAFAVMGVAEYVGIGLGVLGGSALLTAVAADPELIFVGCGLMFLIFLALVQGAMGGEYQPRSQSEGAGGGLLSALKNKALLVFMAANTFFTTYVALITSTIPLYFTNFLAGSDPVPGVSVGSTASLFTWCYIGVGAVVQIPTTTLLAPLRRIWVLSGAIALWGMGFALLWAAGTFAGAQFIWAVVALCLLSVASVAYKPFFIATVSDLAPPSLRGAYIAVSSQCWTVGYFIGPLLGGWAMDQSAVVAQRFWLGVGLSATVCIALLWVFETMRLKSSSVAESPGPELSAGPS